MKSIQIAAALTSALMLGAAARAGAPMKDDKKIITEPCPPDTLTVIKTTTDYVFDSNFDRSREFRGVTRGDALHNDFEVGYRIPLGIQWPNKECGVWYLRLGAEYERYDFGNHGTLPLPGKLQTAAGIVALEYLVKGEIGILLEARPGVYFENQVESGSFDVPIKIGTDVPLSKTLFLTIGAEFDMLRRYPIIPSAGLVWLINDEWVLLGTLPEPKLLFHPTKGFQAWVGGEFTQTAYKTDERNVDGLRTLNGAVVNYSEYRVGAGVTYSGFKPLTVDLAAGYALRREFDFPRAGETYHTDGGAPYLKVQFTADF